MAGEKSGFFWKIKQDKRSKGNEKTRLRQFDKLRK